jgi:hypothetical protein
VPLRLALPVPGAGFEDTISQEAALRFGFVRDVIQEAIQAIEAEIKERQGLISKLRKLSVRPAAVDRADGVARPKWSAARRKKFQATWAKKKAAKAKGA